MDNTLKEMGLLKQYDIWLEHTLRLLGVAFLFFIFAHVMGWPTPFRSLEAMQIDMKLVDVGMAIEEIQDAQVALAQRIRGR